DGVAVPGIASRRIMRTPRVFGSRLRRGLMSTKQMAQQLAALLVCSVLAATASYIRAEEPPSRNVDVLLSNRDFSVSPGRDFFQYANGTWFARNPIPAGEARWCIAGLV